MFRDVQGHWAEASIREAVAAGYVHGYPDGTFRPDAPVTRAELLALTVKALQQAGYLPRIHVPYAADEFDPQLREHWVVKQGFLPLALATTPGAGQWLHLVDMDAAATRLESAVWLAHMARPALRMRLSILDQRRAENWSEAAQAAARKGIEDGVWPFQDAVPAEIRPYVLEAVRSGLIVGLPNGRFGGDEPVTRAQLVAMLQRMAPVSALSHGGPAVPEPALPGRGRVVGARLTWSHGASRAPRPLQGSRQEDWPALNRLITALSDAARSGDVLPPEGVGRLPVPPPHPVHLVVQYADATQDRVESAVRCEGDPSGSRRCAAEPDWMIVNDRVVFAPALWEYYHGQMRLDMPMLPVDAGN
ncbi:S-layer homology domain-containing protein [Caldinitratiruptor microaerophilus]|uniref:S-layer homology domain-containing protein n=1 Tax=Caldinitratiruptor microaerophilus TaxID=671077 RepID=UPI00222E467A|nr:S-layer homology domain-containing protein [Caldinitratiruptor microaerophilus]